MDARIDSEVVRENSLLNLAYQYSDLPFEEPDSRLHLGKLLKQAFAEFSDNVLLDRKIWSAYIPKKEKYIPETYYKYNTGEYGNKEMYRYFSQLFRSTYRYFVIRKT